MADSSNSNETAEPVATKPVTYACRYCGEPLEIEGQYRLMMEHFGMPANSGAHAKCLGMGNDLVSNNPEANPDTANPPATNPINTEVSNGG